MTLTTIIVHNFLCLSFSSHRVAAKNFKSTLTLFCMLSTN